MTAKPARTPIAGEDARPPAAAGPGTAPPIQPGGVHHTEQHPTGKRLALLSLAALGIVYGDIGTSPLYAIKESFNPPHGVPPTVENVYGVLSLIVWSLMLVVSVKYIGFILRADNRGKGGILALLALIHQTVDPTRASRRRYSVLAALGLFGAALLFGEGVITPAISVLSAMEGIQVATPALQRFIVPVTIVILTGLFAVQRFGTGKVGRVFGPVTLVWFTAIATLGVREIVHEPQILLAVSPWYAVQFFLHNGTHGFFILGSVVLVITGVEALYADMGHFGRRPIRLAWFALVFPALLLNYFGQGALLLRDPAAAANPFYLLVPAPLLYPMVVLATTAAIVASQALISGAFSLSQQAVQLGYSPRMTIIHTSEEEAGQIYVPEINVALGVSCIVLVLAFRSSSALAAAYGIAVTGTMVITTTLFSYLAGRRWRWRPVYVALFAATFLVIDLSFFGANVVKVAAGGWFPLAVGVVLFSMMTTWKRGRELLRDILRGQSLPLDLFLTDVGRRSPPRVPGTAVFMTSDPDGTPIVLLHHLKHNKVLHEHVILLSIVSLDVPDVDDDERLTIEPLGHGFHRVIVRTGFMETPNVPHIMRQCAADPHGIVARPQDTTFYLGRERLIPRGTSRLARWRKKLFVFMSRNARTATEYFGIPPNRVVELGTQIEF